MRPKRKTKTFPDGWKLTFSELIKTPPHHQRIADAMIDYMRSTDTHDIRNCERIVMDQYEQEKAMYNISNVGVKFKWRCIAKQHVSPFKERWVFAVYSGINLLAAVFENTNLKGFGVERGDYEAI